MSVTRLLALAEQLYATRELEKAVQNELRAELKETEEVDQRSFTCNILAPNRVLWRLSWDSGGVHVHQTPLLDALEEIPEGRNAVEEDERPARHLLDF